MSKVLFADQNKELTLMKHAGTAFTVEEVLQAVLLKDSANNNTFFNHVFILTRDDETVLSTLFVFQ